MLNSIKEKYRTRVNKKKEEFNQKKSELSAAINKAKKKVTLSRSCSFSFSKYDADTEKFRLTIERKGSSSTKVGYISIPRRDAPKFKKELKKSHVIQLVSPTLSGNWEPVNSNFVLVTSNGKKYTIQSD